MPQSRSANDSSKWKDQDLSSSTGVNASSHPLPPQQGDIFNQLDPSVLSSLDKSQIQAIQTFIDRAIKNDQNQRSVDTKINQNQLSKDQVFSRKKRRSKLIDIRFVIDMIFSRFYVVLLVGKDIRKDQRSYPIAKVTRIGNVIAAIILIVTINLLISAFFLLGFYLLKSALNIDLMPGHFSDQIDAIKQ